MRRLGLGVCICALCALGWSTAANAQTTGEVGGPPTIGHLPFPPPHKKTFFPKATSEAIVIGVGFNPFGKVEIVGQDTKAGLCIFVDQLREGSSGPSSCRAVAVPPTIAADTLTWQTSRRRSKSLSELSGFMQPSVASVIAVARRHKGRKQTRKAVSAIVAVPSQDLLARLHQGTAFGFFAADFRGCLEDAKVRFHAFNATGALLGTSQVNLSFPKRFTDFLQPCKPGAGIAVFG
jgi:hypothetical protein